MSSITPFLPRWTRRVSIQGSGRDPLGLSRVSDEFTGFLLPSIITITPRARYFSFYTWGVGQCASAFEEGGLEAFKERFRCLDTAFAISSRMGRSTDLTITGIDQVNAHFPDPSSKEPVDTLFPVLPSSDWGAFGQAYGSSIDHLGLVQWTEEEVWRLQTGRGSALAEAFGKSVEESPYVGGGHVGGQFVPADVLRDSALSFSLDGIRGKGATAEREILTRIFFDLDDEDTTNHASHRQATLAQLLHVLITYRDAGSPPARRDVNGSCLFWPHYYGSLYIEEEDQSPPYESLPALQETRDYWRQFCVHQFFIYATEEFLQAMLEAMAEEADGVTKDGMREGMLASGFIDDLEKALGQTLPGPVALLEFYGLGEDPEAVQERFSCDHLLCEWQVYDQDYGDTEAGTPVTRLGRAFAIWSQLYTKWRNSEDPAILDVAERAGQEWWIGTLFGWGDTWTEENPDWGTALRELIDVFVSRHEHIKFHKGKLDAAWFEQLGGRFSRIQDLAPDFRASRHPQVITVFQDLCLLEDGKLDEPLIPTEWADEILHEVIQSRS